MNAQEQNGESLVWLHLSDLHACKPGSWDAKEVVETLLADLHHLEAQYGLRPDLVFFTGDAAFGHLGENKGEAIKDQFEVAHSFLERVRNAYATPIPQDNVFLIPGNHDVCRHLVMPALTRWLDAGATLAEVVADIEQGSRQWNAFMERLSEYRAFLKQCGYLHLLADEQRLIYSTQRNVRGFRVGIAGFNSAWSCCRDGEKGKLWMAGKWQVARLKFASDEVDFSIALTHHPPNWLREDEDPVLWRELERTFTFCLHGHEHQAWIDAKANGHVNIAAGACYQSSDLENGYNLVRVTPGRRSADVWLRRYDEAGGGWIPRIIKDKTDDTGVSQLHALRIQRVKKASVPPSKLHRKRAASPRKFISGGLEFVLVPAGPFTMGTPLDRVNELNVQDNSRGFDNEYPPHRVKLAGYYISRFPVTNQQYYEFTRATNRPVPFKSDEWSRDYNWDLRARVYPDGKADHPVVLVSWHDARAFCEWLGGRLPTEAEWEKAARGCDSREWPWGDLWQDGLCNSMESGLKGTSPVGLFSPRGDSPYGLSDMAGNTWEWCSSLIKPYPYDASAENGPSSLPLHRVIRGGASGFNKNKVRCAFRGCTHPDHSGFSIGFRVVLNENHATLSERRDDQHHE